MNKNQLRTGLMLVLLLVLFPALLFAQQEKAKKGTGNPAFDRHLFLLGDAGLSLFHGDLNQYGFAADPRYYMLNGNLGIGYQFSPILGAFGRIGAGRFGGEKDWRNAKLSAGDQIQANLNLSFNLVNAIWGYNPERLFTFAPHIGFGQTNFRARAINLTTGAFLQEVGYAANTPEKGWLGNRALAFTVPIGADFNFKVSEKTDVYANYTFNFVDSDRMDAFQDKDFGQKREGTIVNDMFAHFNVGMRYKLISNSVKNMIKDFGLVTIETIPNPLEERGDSVEITIKGTFPPKYFRKNAVMNFTPVLTYEGGSVALKPINFKGESVSGDGQLVSYANGGSFTYKDKIAYNPKMNVSELVVAPLIYPAKTIVHTTREQIMQNEKYYAAEQGKLADGVIYTSKRIADKARTMVTKDRYEKVTIVPAVANIYYQVNLFNLNWNLPLNKKEENRKALSEVTKHMKNGWEVKDINIAGWASPEGEETFNNNLSGNRSRTAKGYMESEIRKLLRNKKHGMAFNDIKNLKFETSANGPDWNGFMAAVEASNLKDKNAILNVIRSAAPQQREQEIRNMILIYPEIENEILQPLRRSIITINTFEPKKTDDEIARLSTADPSKLTLEELLYATTLTNDLKTKKMIYASGMELHPKCARVVMNAAEVEFQLGNYAESKKLLEKALPMAEKSPVVYNNLAVLNIMERNFCEAEKNLRKSKDLGGDVDYNMGIVNIYKGDYAKAISLMSGCKCDYNLGLAQLLNKDYSAAKATLDCAPATASAFYLKAVIGARTNDSAYLYSNLMKAIEKDGSYKNTAKWDREFVKFFNEPDFKAIVK